LAKTKESGVKGADKKDWAESVDAGEVTKPLDGGIDFNTDLLDLQLQNSGQAVKFNIDPAMLSRLEAMPGFSPVIIDIKPLSSVKAFLGISNN
jgi:hypothetical protein